MATTSNGTPLAAVYIDGREVVVPAGTGLVEAAQQIDIEVPVFCYEPRIGPAVGACRMCLVEIEGMPKLQTACSTPVRDGMVVTTVSDRARDAQEAVLEFLLVNHPLDCPVCDKGGECPLQDQTLRWGPGASRFRELKRNNDKPVPISPLIALDRERCILCYRCTRFSDEVADDNQLIARERGADTVIATFEGRPYTGHFSGNIVELCPVGALTSTEYRFKGRPWETTDHPTVCGLCSVGCNTYTSVREGTVARVLARENSAVDDGWLCDRGRFSYTSLYNEGRVLVPRERPHRDRPAGNRPVTQVSWEGALEWLYAELAAAGTPIPGTEDEDGVPQVVPGATWVLSGYETLEVAWAIQQLAAATHGRVVAIDGGSAAGPPANVAASLADLERAKHVVVIGDADMAELAPIVDLRVRKAVRNGASLTTAGIGGTRLELVAAQHVNVPPGELDTFVEEFCARMKERSGGGALTEPGVAVYRDGELGQAALDALVRDLQLDRPGCGLLAVADAPNARGLAVLGIEPVGLEELRSDGGLVFFNVDPARHFADDEWRPLVKGARWVAAVGVYESPLHEVADLALPATSPWEHQGTVVNLEGRLQRLTVGAAAPAGVRDELSWLAGLARRAGASVVGNAASAYRQLAGEHARRLGAARHGDIPDDGLLGVNGGAAARPRTPATSDARERELSVFVGPFLYDAPDVEHASRMEFLRDTAYITIARDSARALNLARGERVHVDFGDHVVEATVATSPRIAPGHARMLAGAAGMRRGHEGYRTARVTAITIEPAAVGAPAQAGDSD
jgi:NADH-quinone oxidoreductase subunit G